MSSTLSKIVDPVCISYFHKYNCYYRNIISSVNILQFFQDGFKDVKYSSAKPFRYILNIVLSFYQVHQNILNVVPKLILASLFLPISTSPARLIFSIKKIEFSLKQKTVGLQTYTNMPIQHQEIKK